MDPVPPSSQEFDLGYIDDPPVVKLCYGLLTDCVKRHCERVHLVPNTAPLFSSVRVFRDGAWEDLMQLPTVMYKVVMGRFAVMANLDLVRQRSEEKGAFRLAIGPSTYEFKVTKRRAPRGAYEAMIDIPSAPVESTDSA